jgi:hypothetical protein
VMISAVSVLAAIDAWMVIRPDVGSGGGG